MNRYHVNPESGATGVCRAKTICPFGDLEKDHYSSAPAAQAAYEQSMSGNIIIQTHRLEPQSKGNPMLSDLFSLELLNRDIAEGFVAVRTHDDDDSLKILCYGKTTQFAGHWNDVTKAARGLIVRSEEDDFSDAVVLERPWRKFFTLQQLDSGWSLGDEENEGSAFNEMNILDFDAPAEVTDKADGSMGILYSAPDGLPAIATKGSFGSDQANYYTNMLRSDSQLMEEAKGFIENNSSETHLFELVGPENRIVLDYNKDAIILLGTVEKRTGLYHSAKAHDSEWSGGIVESFPAKNLTEALAIPDREGREGLVIRTISSDPEKQLQIKVKQEDYKNLHRILSSFSISDMRVSLRESPATFNDLIMAAETGDITHIKGVDKTFNIESTHPAIAPAMAERRRLLESAALPRLKKLKEAKTYVDLLPDSAFTSPSAAKDFALSIADVEGVEKGDMFSFFQARASGRDISTMPAAKVLRGLAQSISDKNLSREE